MSNMETVSKIGNLQVFAATIRERIVSRAKELSVPLDDLEFQVFRLEQELKKVKESMAERLEGQTEFVG